MYPCWICIAMLVTIWVGIGMSETIDTFILENKIKNFGMLPAIGAIVGSILTGVAADM